MYYYAIRQRVPIQKIPLPRFTGIVSIPCFMLDEIDTIPVKRGKGIF